MQVIFLGFLCSDNILRAQDVVSVADCTARGASRAHEGLRSLTCAGAAHRWQSTERIAHIDGALVVALNERVNLHDIGEEHLLPGWFLTRNVLRLFENVLRRLVIVRSSLEHPLLKHADRLARNV